MAYNDACMNQANKKKTHYLLISSALIILGCIVILACYNNLGSGIRFFNDYSDRLIYAARGSWVLSGKIPYKDIFCEYPQLAVLIFSLPYVLINIFFPSVFPITIYYLAIYQVMMCAFAVGTLVILAKFVGNDRRWRLLLLALPASIYFIYNRFDILPVFFCILSLYLFSREKFILSCIFLACGVMVKWYLCLLVPIYLISYIPLTFKKRFWMAAAFGLTVLAFLVPTFLLGGLDAVLMPYTFHLDRGIESGSLIYFVDTFLNGLFGIHLNAPWLMRVFFLLQFGAIPLTMTNRLNTPEQVLRWSAISIIIFLLFAKFYSPQWWLWLLPLLIPLINEELDTAIIIGFDIITYLGFPVLYDLVSPTSKIYIGIALIQATILIVLAYRLEHKHLSEENILIGRFKRKRFAE